MISDDAAFGQQLLDVPIGQPVAQVPPHRPRDDLRREPEPRELRDRNHGTHTPTTHPSIMPERPARPLDPANATAPALSRADDIFGIHNVQQTIGGKEVRDG